MDRRESTVGPRLEPELENIGSNNLALIKTVDMQYLGDQEETRHSKKAFMA